MLGNLLGKGAVGSVSEYGQSREKTKQWKEWSKVQTEVAAASWRPALSRALGGAVVLHVLIAAIVLLTWLYGVVTQVAWVSEIRPLWSAWLAYAVELFFLATTYLTGYGVARSMFDKAGSKETVRERLTGVFRSPKKAVQEEIERLEIEAPSSVERLPEAAKAVEAYPATQSWEWSARSARRLSRADIELQQLFNWLLPRSPYDLAIGETTRTIDMQRKYVQEGKSKTMKSRHLETPAMAVDFFVINPATGKADVLRNDPKTGKPNPEGVKRYREVLAILMEGSEKFGIPITSGGLHWGWDFFHVEKSRSHYPYVEPVDIALS